MDEKILSKLKLNKENVISVFLACKATPDTPKEDVFNNSFCGIECTTFKAPRMSFDYNKLYNHIHLINYLCGQLKVVHVRKAPFTLAQGLIDYTGKRWTDDNNALFALYYIAVSSLAMPHFVDGEKGPEVQKIKKYYDNSLVPTYPPDDPRFNLEDARDALKDLGVELP